MAESTVLTILDVAAGTGMLSTGVKIALNLIGQRAVTVGGIERDSCAAAAFMAWMEKSQGFVPPVWDDARTFVGRRDRRLEPVDIVCAGYPCQPFSSAGKRLGHKDDRHLWPAVRRVVARVKPPFVFFENVDGHVTLGLWKVLRDLERLGYRVAPGVFSAQEVGAPHLRKRVFIFGAPDAKLDSIGTEHEHDPRERPGSGSDNGESRGPYAADEEERSGGQGIGDRGHELGDPASDDEQRDSNSGINGEREPHRGSGGNLAGSACGGQRTLRKSRRDGQPDGSGRELGSSKLPGIVRQGWLGEPSGDRGVDGRCGTMDRGLFPPGRFSYDRWAELVARGLDPSLMPPIESGVSVVADGVASPADLLRLGGNGVCPLQAAWAFLNLAACVLFDS